MHTHYMHMCMCMHVYMYIYDPCLSQDISTQQMLGSMCEVGERELIINMSKMLALLWWVVMEQGSYEHNQKSGRHGWNYQRGKSKNERVVLGPRVPSYSRCTSESPFSPTHLHQILTISV